MPRSPQKSGDKPAVDEKQTGASEPAATPKPEESVSTKPAVVPDVDVEAVRQAEREKVLAELTALANAPAPKLGRLIVNDQPCDIIGEQGGFWHVEIPKVIKTNKDGSQEIRTVKRRIRKTKADVLLPPEE